MNEVYEFYTGDPLLMNDNRVFSKVPLILVTPAMDPADVLGPMQPLIFKSYVKIFFADN
jgi:hypothetical protein